MRDSDAPTELRTVGGAAFIVMKLVHGPPTRKLMDRIPSCVPHQGRTPMILIGKHG